MGYQARGICQLYQAPHPVYNSPSGSDGCRISISDKAVLCLSVMYKVLPPLPYHSRHKIVVQLALLMLDEIVICVFITEIKGCLVGIIRKNSIAIFIAQHDKNGMDLYNDLKLSTCGAGSSVFQFTYEYPRLLRHPGLSPRP